MRYNVMGYNVDVLRQSACLVRNISHIFQQKCFDINSAETFNKPLSDSRFGICSLFRSSRRIIKCAWPEYTDELFHMVAIAVLFRQQLQTFSSLNY